MRVCWATDQGIPGRRNEDFVAAAPGAVVVLDGCGLPLETDLGCVHGTAWYSRTLGTRLLARILDAPGEAPSARGEDGPGDGRLAAHLAGAITDVAAAHRATCDLTSPVTPAATVVALRVREEMLDYLVLADSTLMLDGPEGLDTITGGRIYAAADPADAEFAITGSVAVKDVRRAFLLTDGATRLTDTFALADWHALAEIVDREGPDALISRTRQAERTDPHSTRWPRGKAHDDATVAHCVFP